MNLSCNLREPGLAGLRVGFLLDTGPEKLALAGTKLEIGKVIWA
jgi:hypothetical protein